MEILTPFLLTIAWSLFGFVLLYLAYLALDRLTPGNAQEKIFSEGNVAVAILKGSFIIALGIIIAAVITG
jgi:putative membrane protein